MQLTYKVSPQAIAKAISKVSGFSVYELKNEGHSHTLAQWRHLGMYLARESGMTYVEAGEVFNRHFSTALTSHRKVKKSLDDPLVSSDLTQIKTFLNKQNKEDGNQEIL
jgi:chromosomal replication initiation ATPase DnaA